MTPVIIAEGLQKQFGSAEAVRDVHLSVQPGRCFGFVGPNGAGKTTTIRLLTGLIQPTAGRVTIFGKTYEDTGPEIKSRIGLVQGDLMLYEYLTGEEQMLFSGRIYGLPSEAVASRVNELFDLLDLNHCRTRLVRTYSHGERKNLSWACALIHDPDVLFLDEPFEGIDVISLRKIEGNLKRMIEGGKTVFLTSHILSWVDRFCDDVAIINKGSIVFSGSRNELREAIKGDKDQANPVSDIERAFTELIQSEKSDVSLSWLA